MQAPAVVAVITDHAQSPSRGTRQDQTASNALPAQSALAALNWSHTKTRASEVAHLSVIARALLIKSISPAALSMTLCEIATAEHQSPPMECIPFQVGHDGQPPRYVGDSPGKCVE